MKNLTANRGDAIAVKMSVATKNLTANRVDATAVKKVSP